MCEFPSWIKDSKGKPHWLVDKDIQRAIEDGKLKDWDDATGHSAIEKVLGVNGEHIEGREGLPDGFASDIRSGRCNRMARVEPMQAVKHVLDLLPPGLQLAPDGKWAGNLDLWGITITPELQALLSTLTTVSGSLYARRTTGLSLPKLTEVSGSLDAEGTTGLSLPKLTEVSGYLDARSTTGLSLPRLTTVGGSLYARSTTGLSLPKLTECGYLDARSTTGLSLPKLTEVSDYLDAEDTTGLSLPRLTTVGGSLYARSTTGLSLPKLTECGYLDARGAKDMHAPKLKR